MDPARDWPKDPKTRGQRCVRRDPPEISRRRRAGVDGQPVVTPDPGVLDASAERAVGERSSVGDSVCGAQMFNPSSGAREVSVPLLRSHHAFRHWRWIGPTPTVRTVRTPVTEGVRPRLRRGYDPGQCVSVVQEKRSGVRGAVTSSPRRAPLLRSRPHTGSTGVYGTSRRFPLPHEGVLDPYPVGALYDRRNSCSEVVQMARGLSPTTPSFPPPGPGPRHVRRRLDYEGGGVYSLQSPTRSSRP